MERDDGNSEFFKNGGFSRQLPETCFEYMLFVIDSQFEAPKTFTALDGVRKSAAQLCDNLTKDYIWQRDAFHIEVKLDGGKYFCGLEYSSATVAMEQP